MRAHAPYLRRRHMFIIATLRLPRHIRLCHACYDQMRCHYLCRHLFRQSDDPYAMSDADMPNMLIQSRHAQKQRRRVRAQRRDGGVTTYDANRSERYET